MDVEKLKKLLGITGTDQDPILEFIIDDVTETVKNYCNISSIPQGLLNTAYRMAMDLYRNENIGDSSISIGQVSSITEGDTSTSFKSSTAEFKDHIMKDYKSQLNKFRKMVW
jgi:Phage QLRG family, putative DNA packaging.